MKDIFILIVVVIFIIVSLLEQMKKSKYRNHRLLKAMQMTIGVKQ